FGSQSNTSSLATAGSHTGLIKSSPLAGFEPTLGCPIHASAMFTAPSPSLSLSPSSKADCASSPSTGVLGLRGSSPSASSAQFGSPSLSSSSHPSSWPFLFSSGSSGSNPFANSNPLDIPSP